MTVKDLLTILLDSGLALESPVFIVIDSFNGTDVPNTICTIKTAHISKNRTVLLVPNSELSLNS